MSLADLVQRTSTPVPWAEGDNIPWNEPGFSRRMLREHLTQEHDAASRRFEIIDRQVAWIQTALLAEQPTTILDLACGPGLYSERLARLGHTCHGIDYSPASIDYARETAQRDHLPCTYVCQDIRRADFHQGYGLVMLIYGEFNVFRPVDAKIILAKAWQALRPGGRLLLEPHPYQVVQQLGEKPAAWYSSPGGLFSERPHVVLKENFWDAGLNAVTIRYFVIDAATAEVTQYAQSLQAYQDEGYRSLLSACGFGEIQFYPGLSAEDPQENLIAISARK
jgi:SAM-dependent methyltransferase